RNHVEGNYIGTDKNGTAPLGNRENGVLLSGALNNFIGGFRPFDGDITNVISANRMDGVRLTAAAMFNHVEGNLIGTDVSGLLPLGNALNGVYLDAISNWVGMGTWADRRGNVISANGQNGAGTTGFRSRNQVEGNYIGTDKDGADPNRNMG